MKFFFKSKWVDFACTEMKLGEAEARRRWELREQEAGPHERLLDGPEDEPLKLAMHVEDFISGKTQVEVSKAMTLESKGEKPKNMQQLDDGKLAIQKGHMGFNAAPFQLLAGDLSSTSNSQLGQTRIVGLNAGSSLPPTALPSKFGETVEFGDSTKKKKSFKAEDERLKLHQVIESYCSNFDEQWKTVTASYALTLAVMDAAKHIEVPGLEHWRDMHARRYEFGCILMLKFEAGGTDGNSNSLGIDMPESFDAEVTWLESLVLKVGQIKSLSKEAKEKSQDLSAWIAEQTVEEVPLDLIMHLRKYGFCGDKFVTPLDEAAFQALLGLANKLLFASKAEFILAHKVRFCTERRTPLPAEGMTADSCLPWCRMKLHAELARHCASEHEVSSLKSLCETAHKQACEILKKTNDSAKDVQNLINRKMARDASKIDTEAKKAVREQQRLQAKAEADCQRKAKATAKASANKGASAGAASILSKELGIPDMPSFWNFRDEKISQMQIFEDTAAAKSKLVEMHAASTPFVVKASVDLDAVIKEASVTAALDLYRVQCVNQSAVKVTGRGQLPFHSDRKARLAECMKNTVTDVSKKAKLQSGIASSLGVVHVFGANHKMQYYAAERNSLPNLRYMFCGARQVVLIRYDALESIAATHSIEIRDQESVTDWGRRIIESITPEDLDKADINKNVRKARHSAGETMVIPGGMFTVEKTVFDDANKEDEVKQKEATMVGLRVHYLEASDMPGSDSIRKMMTKQVNQQIANDKVSAYWKTVLDALPPLSSCVLDASFANNTNDSGA